MDDDGKFVKPEDKTPGSNEEENKDILNWDFIKVPMNGANNSNDIGNQEPDVVHHLKENNIYENSFDDDDEHRKADSNAAS